MQATRAAAEDRRDPPRAVLETAKKASRRARNAGQLRIPFISRESPDAPVPPLARMLRGGRGGQVRLKLLLTFLWFQTDGTTAVPLAYPAQLWAQLIGLHDPQGAGARRINEAQRWLETHGLITVEAQPGHANRITVLNETGNGTRYTPPGRAANLLRDNPQAASSHYYVQLPAELWTNGYMAAFKGASLAFYLTLLDQYGPGQITAPGPVWFSPKLFKDRYALSDDTRAKGMKELRDLGLITIGRQLINPEDFDLDRIRNTYTLDPQALEEPAHWRAAPDKPMTMQQLLGDLLADTHET